MGADGVRFADDDSSVRGSRPSLQAESAEIPGTESAEPSSGAGQRSGYNTEFSGARGEVEIGERHYWRIGSFEHTGSHCIRGIPKSILVTDEGQWIRTEEHKSWTAQHN